MKNKFAAFVLALSLTSLTACGSFSEAGSESSSSSETIYIMTTTQTSPQIAVSTTATTTTTAAVTTTAPSTATTQPTTHTLYSEPVSTLLTTLSETAPATTLLPAGETSTDKHTTTEKHTIIAHRTTEMRLHTTQPSRTTEKTITETTLATTQPTTESTTVPAIGETKMVGGIIVADYGTDHPRAIEPFSNNNKVSTRYAQTLEQYQSELGDDIRVWCMVVPTSQAFYTPEDVASKYGDQLTEYHNIAEHLEHVTGVPVWDALQSHTDEPIYSRTDYHWQPLAAYYAGEQFAAFAGVPYAPLDTYDSVTRDGYVGAFSKVNKVTLLEEYPEEFTYYKPANLEQISCTYYNTSFGNARQGSLFHEDNSVNASYTVFVGTDDCILETDTNVDNSRVLVIFKDSYGNALVPFLTQSFSKIYLCDFRYFNQNAIDFMQEVGATDVLFAMSTVAVTTSSKVDQVASLLN